MGPMSVVNLGLEGFPGFGVWGALRVPLAHPFRVPLRGSFKGSPIIEPCRSTN